MNPLPDRTVIVAMLATLGVVFALVFWFVRLSPPQAPSLQWRQGPGAPVQPGSPLKPSQSAVI